MIRGNETAIELGLDVLAACSKPGTCHNSGTFAEICNEARSALGLRTEPLTKQDFWYIEHRALVKLQRAILKRFPELRADLRIRAVGTLKQPCGGGAK